MGGIVVEDGVDHLAGRDGLDGCDEADELLMPMARRAAADDLAFEHAERGEQGRRAVAFVIVREGSAFPRFRGRPGWVRSSASRADADGHVWQDADRRAARAVDRRGRQDARMAERFAARLPAPHPGRRRLDRRGLSRRDQSRRVRRALNAVFAGPVGKDVVSRVWRKTKSDWDAWNARSLAEEPIVRLILDGTVARVRLDRKATSISLLVGLGVRADGQKVLLAIKSMSARARRPGARCSTISSGADCERRSWSWSTARRASKRRWRRCGPTWLSKGVSGILCAGRV